MALQLLTTEVVAVVATVDSGVPQVLTVGARDGVPALPSGPLLADHRSLQAGLRAWVEQQTGLRLGFVEQLYTFADRERIGAHERMISVSYIGLTPPTEPADGAARWCPWYELFPWEDRRRVRTEAVLSELRERLSTWVRSGARAEVVADRSTRVRLAFGDGERAWHAEDCLSRYELLWEAGLLPESAGTARPGMCRDVPLEDAASPEVVGRSMRSDHRRMVATAMGRLRSTIQYRPVVFEVMQPTFTLGQLQTVVEAFSGTLLHKQNFRRLVESEELVEETGERTAATGGRPAKLVRFRADVLSERPGVGLRLPQARQR
ncbi:Uncharacterized conserved protein [Austwickia chelonae]|uniref:NrtR DNA-binding winged helix domain-containing protein n=1 Tax=Austwickia chelonae NBRC 105200 TaxID=1184607 RepID=K6ULV2_9MICO|nr:hypothetical protein [Austwickia chelonae]GAB77571.1 hypothetical protein AUCHE_05_04840 [Austwickia chelonae NBRC 105200]SEW13168.1 Uncharacterized conserved protein [Austwickia chelonae]